MRERDDKRAPATDRNLLIYSNRYVPLVCAERYAERFADAEPDC